METFLDRLINEKNDLQIKFNKLNSFMLSDKFNELDINNQSLLNIQVSAMETYLKCLLERINIIN